MNTLDMALEMLELMKSGGSTAAKALYADDAVSVEASPMPTDGPTEWKGIQAIKAKGEWWRANHEVHGVTMAGPWPLGNRFAIAWKFDLTFKPSGERYFLDELGLFTIEGGKIVREEFFYSGMN